MQSIQALTYIHTYNVEKCHPEDKIVVLKQGSKNADRIFIPNKERKRLYFKLADYLSSHEFCLQNINLSDLSNIESLKFI